MSATVTSERSSSKWSDVFENRWNRLPIPARNIIVSAVVFTMGSTVRGEWILIWMYLSKALDKDPTSHVSSSNSTFASLSWSPWRFNLNDFHLQGLGFYWLWATGVSFAFYLISGGFLYWYYYIVQRHQAADWKCQPNKFPSEEVLRQEILLGSVSLLLASSVTGVLACYVMNGGRNTIYFNMEDYGWFWFFLSVPIVFVWQDYLTYWLHRLYHQPFLYRHVHKVHHKFKQPTAFSATAFHPVELHSLQAVLFSPMFLFPVHWTIFVGSLIYNYYHGILDHSGVDFRAGWWQPWQPDAIFHDDHHRYTYGNFGVNCKYWDKIHGTERKLRQPL